MAWEPLNDDQMKHAREIAGTVCTEYAGQYVNEILKGLLATIDALKAECKMLRHLDGLGKALDKTVTEASLCTMMLDDRDTLKADLKKVTVCDCGRRLSTGLCNVCDNDD